MSAFRVYELQQETVIRKWIYEVEAPDENSAMLAAKGKRDPIECGTIGEPFYGDSGFAALSPEADSAKGWDEALSNLESVKGGDGSAAHISVVEAIEVALNYFEDTRHGREWTETGGVETDMLRRALKALQN